jgi:transcriptional regulator with XRE-family HTH domain
MDVAMIGAILRKRIHVQGFTQEDFAEKAGIGYATLKKYLNGSIPYSIEKLEKFSEILDCSFDYLMGVSSSSRREYLEISNELHLSDNAIDIIRKHAKDSDIKVGKKVYMITLNSIIEKDGFIKSISDYLMGSKFNEMFVDMFNNKLIELFKKQNLLDDEINEADFRFSNSTTIIMEIVEKLAEMKATAPKELTEDIKKEYQKADFARIMNEFKLRKKGKRK